MRYAIKQVSPKSEVPYVRKVNTSNDSFAYTDNLSSAALFSTVEAAVAAIVARTVWASQSGDTFWRSQRFTIVGAEAPVRLPPLKEVEL